MQTFLPYSDFEKTASVLDWKRLGKQRVEARQILTAIRTHNSWFKHPAVKMWVGFEDSLIEYSNTMIREWIRRGYNNSMPIIETSTESRPGWMGMSSFHAAHRSNLLRKDFEYYSQFGWEEDNSLPYVWPVRI